MLENFSRKRLKKNGMGSIREGYFVHGALVMHDDSSHWNLSTQCLIKTFRAATLQTSSNSLTFPGISQRH